MKATPIFKEKRVLTGKKDQFAIAELRIWKIPTSKDYPEGRKFSLFLVQDGKVLIGIDNHKPKGPHLHFEGKELPYNFVSKQTLLEDFWKLVKEEGFII